MTQIGGRRTIRRACAMGFRATAAGALAAMFASGCAATSPPPVQVAAVDQAQARPPASTIAVGKTGAGNYLAGQFALRTRDYGGARTFLSKALAVDEDNTALLRRTFMATLADGQVDDAVSLAQKLAALEPGGTLETITIAVADVSHGALDGAEKTLATMRRRGLGRFLAPLLVAWAQAGQGRTDDALATLRPIGDETGFSVLYNLHAGLIEELADNLAEAEKFYRLALEARERPSLRVVEALGRLLERQGRSEDARAVYEDYTDDYPTTLALERAFDRLERHASPRKLVPTAREGMAEAIYNVAGTLNRENSIQLALMYGRLAVELRPDFPVAQILVADILESLERYHDAIAVYDRVSPDSPLYWTSRMRKAGSLDAAGDTEAAIALLETLATERPDRAAPLVALGDVLRGKERFAESVKAYDRAAERIKHFEPRHWSLFYSRGIALERSNQWERAEADFLHALKLHPDQPYVLNYLGYSWIDLGRNLTRARSMIERAVALRPNDGYIIDSLGWALYRMRDFDGAVVHLERAASIRPRDPTINDHLGDAFWRVGRKQEARFQWRRALSLDPEPKDVPNLQRKLRRGLPELVQTDNKS